MPPFRYDAPDTRSANSIAALMARQGDIEAQRAQASGQAWAGAAQAIGQAVSGTIAQATDPRRRLEQQAVTQGQELRAGQQRLDQVTAPYAPNGPQPEGAGPAAAQHPYLDAQGLYDIPKLTQALSASGLTHLAPELLKGAESINESILKHQDYEQKAAQQQTILFGDMADGVTKMVKAGMPFDQALDLAAAPGLATKRFDPQQFAQVKAQLLRLPTDQQQAALGQLMDAAAKLSPEKDLWKDAQRLDRYNRVTATNAVQELEKATFGIPQPDGSVKNVEGTFNKKTGEYAYQGQVVPNAVKDATPPPTTEAGLDAEFQKLEEKRLSGTTLTAAERAKWSAFKNRKTLGAVTNFNLNAGKVSDARLDKSYSDANRQLTTIRSPLDAQAERMGRLIESVNQKTPQADALIAPELLTVMAGGQGSGLRMNEAEISRIVGGRSNMESLKAALNKWQVDPTKALSITDAQRVQIRDLIAAVQKRTSEKLDAINTASESLIDAGDVESHRRIISDLRKKLDTVNMAGASTTGVNKDPLGLFK
jgi:hypothetical protein